ncbi:MAG: hypothetical protein KC493_14890 [Bacteriovoracaceae bacterium]|nr:hypothetical protein [Bacteriovoracaceae bacterium]
MTAILFFLKGDQLHYGITIIYVYTLSQFVRFYFSLTFGVSLGSLLMGIRADGRWLWKRIGGGGRVVFETFTAPLLLLDLPLLGGNPTFKEKLSFTRIVEKTNLFAPKSRYFLIPLFLSFAFIAPLLQNLTLIDGLMVSFSTEKQEKLGQNTNFDSFKYHTSNRFKLNSFTSLKEQRFVLLPSFQITKRKNKKRINPFLVVYDTKNGIDGEFRIAGKVGLLGLLEKSNKGNPLFKARYPELSELLNEDRKIYQKKPYRQEYGKKFLISSLVTTEVESLVQSSFELSLSRLFSHVMENGPFIRGYVDLRNSLLTIPRKGTIPNVDIVKMGSTKFLRFKQIFDNPPDGQRAYQETLVPMATNNALIYKFNWGKGMQDALSRKDFRESFFGVVDWYFDYSDVFTFPETIEDMKPLHILDFFTKDDLSKKQRDILEEYIYHYYFKLGRDSLKKNDDKMRNFIISSLNRLFLIARLKNSHKNYYSSNFFNLVTGLKKSLKNKSNQYFNF